MWEGPGPTLFSGIHFVPVKNTVDLQGIESLAIFHSIGRCKNLRPPRV
jgi:hypothetical protein